jgi:uncharacterized protein involved in response to NO
LAQPSGLAVIGVLIAGNVVFHAEVYTYGGADHGIRIGLGAVILLISIMGGRVVPSFTRNWLARREMRRLKSTMPKMAGWCAKRLS